MDLDCNGRIWNVREEEAEPEPEPDEETVAAAGVTADEELVPLMAGEEELVPLAWEPLAEEELVACAFSISISCDPHWISFREKKTYRGLAS